MRTKRLGAPRRDGAALGFGLAFLVFGAAGMLRALDFSIETTWLYPLVFVTLGAAGLVSLLVRAR